MDRVTSEWIRSDADKHAAAQGCWFDENAALHVRKFFVNYLRHSKGEWAGKPFELQPWQWEGIIAPLFGWKRADGTRRYRKGGIWIAKKNGKSAIASGLSLYMLLGDGEAGAEVYNAAADREQASIVFNEAMNMVNASPALASRLDLVPSVKRIVYRQKASFLKALSADVPTKEGLNWHFLLFDELHAQAKRDLWDTLAYGGAARRQPLLLSISTAGYDRDSIGYEQYRYAREVLAGNIVDPAFFPFIAEAAEDDDWKAPAVWRKANPNIGVSIRESEMVEACREAEASPSKQNAFRRYRLNQWTEQDIRWLDMDRWDACAGAVDAAELHGRDCFAGLDLASTTDVAALVLLFPQGDSYDVLPFFWVPENACKDRERRNKTRLDEWIRQGLLEVTPGDVIDYDRIRKKINDLRKDFNILEIAVDRWNSTQLSTQLQGDGFEMVAFGQGFASMTAPTKELETLILAGRLRHGGHAVLRWMAGNVSVEQDAAGNLKPSKKRSTEKIDGIVALVMALGRAMVRDAAEVGACFEVWGE